MRNHLNYFVCFSVLFFSLCPFSKLSGQSLPSKSEVISTLKKVNESWISRNPNPGNNQWARAAYFTGNLDFYKVYPKQQYLDYANLWAGNNNWTLNGGSSTSNADNQCVGQVYIDLYKMDNPPQPSKIEKISRSIKRMVDDPVSDDWWWIDALYMSMPIFTRLGVMLNDTSYFEKMHKLYLNTKVERKLYNAELGLWYRDESFAPPYKTPNGRGSYWSRGNGWVFACHARVLQLLPEDNCHRAEYIETFRKMAGALKNCQRNDGFWNVSLDDPDDFGGPETSGTSFFTYGMAWGINNRLLDSATYAPVVANAWSALTSTAVHEDGFLGFVQGVGSNPSSSQPVTFESTADFGVGAFLLAGSEVVKLAGGDMPQPSVFFVDSVRIVNPKQILVYFNLPVDPVSGAKAANYAIDGVDIKSVETMAGNNFVTLTVNNLSLGEHLLVVHNILSTTEKMIEAGQSVPFFYYGNIRVTASSFEAGSENTPERTLDFDFNTRWSAMGVGEWIQYDLGKQELVTSVDLSFYLGNQRYQRFSLSLSSDGETFAEVFNGRSGGTSVSLENFDFTDTNARYVKVTCFGNSQSLWNSITEVRINTQGSAKEQLVNSHKRPTGLFPNPYDNQGLSIKTNAEPGSRFLIRIFDLSGKLVTSRETGVASERGLHWPELILPKGSYLVSTSGQGEAGSALLLVK